GLGQLAVATGLRGEVEGRGARPQVRHGSSGYQPGSRPSRDQRGRDEDVVVRDSLGERILLAPLFLRGELARISACGLLTDDPEVEKVRSQALDLLPHD